MLAKRQIFVLMLKSHELNKLNGLEVRLLIFSAVVAAILLIVIALTSFAPKPERMEAEIEKKLELGSVKSCKLTVVVDNNPDSSLEATWGVSILAEAGDLKILFDTGPDPGILKRNLMKLGVDSSKIDMVVISHGHHDHVGGLPYLAEAKPGLRVYVPKGLGKGLSHLKLDVVEINDTTVIADGVAIIGPLYGPPTEQALALNVEGKGLVILVGCSHPGVVNIVRKARDDLGVKPYLVLGGFHMAGCSEEECRKTIQELLELGMEKISPIHCSGRTIREILREEYPNNYIECYVGCRIMID